MSTISGRNPSATPMSHPGTSSLLDAASVDEPAVAGLVRLLGSHSWIDRRHGEESLVRLGCDAVPALLKAMHSGEVEVRRSATRALCRIADARSAPALVAALSDDDGGVRWVAADALRALGRHAVAPLLQALCDDPANPQLQEGADTVLRNLGSPQVAEVIRTLESRSDPAAIAAAACAALPTFEPVHPTGPPRGW